MRQGRVLLPKSARLSRVTMPTDAEVFRSPLLVSCDMTEADRAKALHVVRRELGDGFEGVARMLGLVPA